MPHFSGCDSSEKSNLEYLPVHVLYGIFCYLDIRSLFSLSAVCRRLNNIIKDDYLNFTSCSLLVTNQLSNEIKEKSLNILPGIHKYRNYFHWLRKDYTESVFLKSVERFRPWLQLRGKDLFVSHGPKILYFKRNRRGINPKPYVIFNGHVDDVVRFVVKDNLMISGGNDGKICCWEVQKGESLFSITTPIRFNDSLYTDFKQSTVAAGSSILGEVNLYMLKDNGFRFQSRTNVHENIWSIALSEDAALCAIGCGGYKPSPLKILDVNRGLCIDTAENFKMGAGIFDIVWETPHILLTGGFDTMLQMWDTRSGRSVLSWSDPYDAAIYTLATDYNCTIMTGSALHSRITLWDKRHSNNIQVYFISKGKFAGPVYSFDFEPSFLFAALDTSLHILDFSKRG